MGPGLCPIFSFSQAITFLQSAARLRGSEEVTEQDIFEIAGVSDTAHKISIMSIRVVKDLNLGCLC